MFSFLLAKLSCDWQGSGSHVTTENNQQLIDLFGEENVEIGHAVRDRETVKPFMTAFSSGEIFRPLSSKMKWGIKLSEENTVIGACVV